MDEKPTNPRASPPQAAGNWVDVGKFIDEFVFSKISFEALSLIWTIAPCSMIISNFVVLIVKRAVIASKLKYSTGSGDGEGGGGGGGAVVTGADNVSMGLLFEVPHIVVILK